jgi:hypothetical protein
MEQSQSKAAEHVLEHSQVSVLESFYLFLEVLIL